MPDIPLAGNKGVWRQYGTKGNWSDLWKPVLHKPGITKVKTLDEIEELNEELRSLAKTAPRRKKKGGRK